MNQICMLYEHGEPRLDKQNFLTESPNRIP